MEAAAWHLAKLLGLEWQGSPLRTGLRLLEETISPARRAPLADPSIFLEHRQMALVWNWQKEIIAATPHFYDKHGAYLVACSSVVCGVGSPSHLAGRAAEDAARAALPGLYRLEVAESLPPWPPIWQRPGPEGWEYAPTLKLARDAGLSYQVCEAWCFPESHALLRPFYERCKAARSALLAQSDPRAQEALDLLKALYVRALGILAHVPDSSPAGKLFRPDWYSLVRANARAALLYNALAVERQDRVQPRCANVDCLGYPVPVASLRLGDGPGQFSYELRHSP